MVIKAEKSLYVKRYGVQNGIKVYALISVINGVQNGIKDIILKLIL